MISATGGFPVSGAASIPAVTAATMAELDRLAIEEFGIEALQMMEHAGSHLAELVRAELGGDLRAKRIIVAVGPGDHGGGGLAAARHLANRGASVRVVLARPVSRSTEAARHELATLLQMSIDCGVAIYDIPNDELDAEIAAADAIADAIEGYRSVGAPHDSVRWLVERVARTSIPVISLDLPSGTDPDTGAAAGAAIHAAATLALALPKAGLFSDEGRSFAGRVH
ncbi:MAG: NAD(P)H-hydrate epimerase, partial [Chloroflexi bacterium]|nr:NAD(P)H-hydrate epimerase [Chloroflexota bacterium]